MKDDFEHIITKTSIDLLHKGKNEEINVASNRDLLVETNRDLLVLHKPL